MSRQYVSLVLLGVTLSLAQLALGFVRPGSIPTSTSRENLARSPSKAAARTTHRKMSAGEQEAKGTERADAGEEDQKSRTKAPAWMFNDQGVAYAPWMVDQFDPENLAKVQASIERRKQKEAESAPEALGALGADPQQMELSGVGLTAKRVMGDSVELTWKTGDEQGNLGFVVSRRAAKTDDWEEISSFQSFAPLNSKGPQGGSYAFVDEDVPEGAWVYRISDMSKNGVRNDMCQTLINMESSADAMQTKIGVAGLVLVLLAAAAAGTINDPFQ